MCLALYFYWLTACNSEFLEFAFTLNILILTSVLNEETYYAHLEERK